jgi:hypothetical protein
MTREELLAAADCAEKYPPGHYLRFLYDDPESNMLTHVAARLACEPSAVRFG